MSGRVFFLTCCFLLVGVCAESAVAGSITVENPSFEDPPGGKQVGVEPNGWTVAGSDFGIEGVSCEGLQSLFLGKNNSGYQLTDHTIAACDEYTLTFDAFKTWPESPTATYEGWLYYTQGANREQIALVEGNDVDMDCDEYQLSYTVQPSDSFIGKKLGVLFTNTSTYGGGIWVGFDNVRLDVNTPLLADNPNPADGSDNISYDVILSWTPGPDANAHDVYLGTDSSSVSNATTSSGEYMLRQDTNSYDVNGYDPCGLEFSTTYYWRVDGVNGPSSQDGDIWSFTVRGAGDFTCDGVADSNDLRALADDWLNSGYGIIIAEAYKDNQVDFKDYAILADTWHWGRYFVDSNDGNDNNSGRSPGEAWKSLSPVNGTTFMPGDTILFKADTTYTGQLKPQGSGASGKPIIIDMYGDGNKPRIDGEGLVLDTLLLENVEYWEVSNLEITNTGVTVANNRHGVTLHSSNYGTVHHIYLRNLYVHDVNGSNDKGSTEGVGILMKCGGATPSNFDDILIEDCHLVRCDRNGIDNKSAFYMSDSYDPNTQTRAGGNWFPSTNVVIRGNLLEDIGGDCIKIISCDGALAEFNVCHYGRQRCDDCAAGIWPWSSDNTVMQFNEASHMKAGCDAQGFDVDDNCINTIVQYNYSHDNDGGFILLCSAPDGVEPGSVGTYNTVVRYNISQNDGDAMDRVIHYCGDNFYDNYVYNNVFYLGSGKDAKMILFGDWGGYSQGPHYYYNNIFYADGTYNYDLGASNYFFENNVFYGNHNSPPYDPNAITADPLLAGPGTGGSGLDSVDGYQLQAGSPCIGAGQLVSDNGGRDYWDNLVSDANAPDIGAHQYSN